MDALKLSIISIIISSISTIIIAVSAYLLWKQIKGTNEWNRRKTSQETLNSLVTGDFPGLRNRLEEELDCHVWNRKETYSDKIKDLGKEEKVKLETALKNLLNIFETICINIKNKIIDEDICYDYLGWIMVEYKRWSEPFIDQRRKMAADPRVLADFTKYANKWSQRMEQERRDIRKEAQGRDVVEN